MSTTERISTAATHGRVSITFVAMINLSLYQDSYVYSSLDIRKLKVDFASNSKLVTILKHYIDAIRQSYANFQNQS